MWTSLLDGSMEMVKYRVLSTHIDNVTLYSGFVVYVGTYAVTWQEQKLQILKSTYHNFEFLIQGKFKDKNQLSKHRFKCNLTG